MCAMHAQPTAVETLRAIRTRQVEYPPELSPDARAFIQSVLIHSPEARPTVAQLLASPLIKHHMERKINTAKRTHANGYFLQGHATLDVDTYVNSSSQPSPFTFAPVAAGGAAGSASALGKGVGASQGTSIAVPKASASSSVAKSLPALNCISKSLAGVSVSSTGSGNSDGGGSGGGPPLSPTGIALLNAQAATYGKPDAASLFRSTRPSPQSKSGILPPAAPTPAAAHAPPPAGHAFHSPILNPPTNSTSPFASPGANAAANAKVAEVAADMGATATAGSRGSGKPAATGLMMRISNMRRAKSVNADLSRKGS